MYCVLSPLPGYVAHFFFLLSQNTLTVLNIINNGNELLFLWIIPIAIIALVIKANTI